MPHPKFQLYKHIKITGKWRYCRAAIYSNGKVKACEPDGDYSRTRDDSEGHTKRRLRGKDCQGVEGGHG